MAIHPDVESGQRARHAGTSEIEKKTIRRGLRLFASFPSSGLGLDGCRSKTSGGGVGIVSVCP